MRTATLSFSTSSFARSIPFSSSIPLFKVRASTAVNRRLATARAILLRPFTKFTKRSTRAKRLPNLEAVQIPHNARASTAPAIRAAPLNQPPSLMAEAATGGIWAPSCSYTLLNTGMTLENSTKRTTKSITTIITGYVTAFFMARKSRYSFS